MHEKKVGKHFLCPFFGHPNRSKSTKTYLGGGTAECNGTFSSALSRQIYMWK